MLASVRFVLLPISIVCCLAGFVDTTFAQSKVVLEHTAGGHRLLRNGKPYAIRGVGGSTQLKLLAALGGNSIRTWSIENLDRVLDEAEQNQLTVCVGFWLGHQRHGFDYQDRASVLKQLEDCLAAVRRYKDHPAVLMWGIGNEMEGSGNNPAIWYAVDHIAREIHQIDPNHPTMTVIAELGNSKVQDIERLCPSVDIIGVNSYGGIGTLATRYRAAQGTKPYIITEFGPRGPWEVSKTEWGAPIEISSTEKGKQYSDGYRQAVAEAPGLCLGSYAFLWGNKQETTATWFGMLLPDGTRLEAADAMAHAWTGKPLNNRSPRIESLTADRTTKLKPGEVVHATLTAKDPDKDALDIRWILRSDAGTVGAGGDAQAEEQVFAKAVVANGARATVTIPESGGGYRLFAYVYDGKRGAAVGNIPLHVDSPMIVGPAPRGSLPVSIYSEGVGESPYFPSGYMGNTKAIQMALDCQEQPHSGIHCLKVEYQAKDQWGGVLWQSPAEDWNGERPGGLDLSGATELEFWVRGAEGGESVNFLFGVLDGNQPYRDTAKGELKEVRLSRDWQRQSIRLDGRDLTRIKTGFGWSMAGQGKPITFYLDDIRFVGKSE